MAINLTAKYASAIEKLYTHSSFLRPHCKANVEMTGAKSCRAIDDTVLDWDDRITRGALPHGLASALMIDEEDKQAQMVLEHNYFVEALEDAAPAVFAYDREDGTE